MADERALHQLVVQQRRPLVVPVTQLPLEVGVGLLEGQALPVRHTRPFADQFDGGELHQRPDGRTGPLRIVAAHIELHAIAADPAGQVQALSAGSDDDLIGGVKPGDQGARTEVADVQLQPDDGGVAVLAVTGVQPRRRGAHFEAVVDHILVDKRDRAGEIEGRALQLDLVVVEQDGGQVLHRVLAGNVDLIVDVTEGIAEPGHLREGRDDHVFRGHRHAGREIGDLLAGDQRGGDLRLAEQVVHAHQRFGEARDRSHRPHHGPVGRAGIGLEFCIVARIGRRRAAGQQDGPRKAQHGGQ